MKCKTCGHELKEKRTLKIKELKIEVTYPAEYTGQYNKIEIPKGWKLINVRDLWWILDESKYMNDFLGNFKGEWNRFWCEQTKHDKKAKQSRWLVLDGYLVLYSDWGNLDYSDSDGRVVFVRDLK